MTISTLHPRPGYLADEHQVRTGRRLAALRRYAGMSQEALGMAIGRPQYRIARLEKGVVRLLFSEALEIAAVLGTDVRLLDPVTALSPAPRGPSPNRLGRDGRRTRLPLKQTRQR